MFNKLKILGLSFITTVMGLIPSVSKPNFVMVSADSVPEYTSTALNWGASSPNGGPYYWEYQNNNLPFVNYSNYDGNTTINFDLVQVDSVLGSEIFGVFYDENYEVADQYADCGQLMDMITIDTANINYVVSNHASVDLVLNYPSDLFTSLRSIARLTNTEFNIPALYLDNELFAMFNVSSNGINLYTISQLVNTVKLGVSEDNYIDAGNNRHHQNCVYVDLNFKYDSSSYIIHEISYLTGDFFYSPYNNRCYVKETNLNYILPYDITYFDYQRGEIGLGHSIYGDVYGTGSPSKILTNILFENDSYGAFTYYWTLMTSSDYNTYIDTESEFFETPAQILGKFAYAPRPLSDNEVGGSGGLVWQPYCWYPNYDITKSSQIKIKSVTFATPDEHSLFIDDVSNSKTYSLPDGLFTFNYFCDKAIGHCSTEMYEMNFDTGGYTQRTNWWIHVAYGVLTLGVGNLVTGIVDSVMETNANRGLNIQRFYFNIKDNYNQLIPNVTKIQFKYQMGKKDIIKDYNNDGTLDIGKYSDLPVGHMEVTLKDTTTQQDVNWYNTITHETNGFVSIEDSPAELVSENGISNSYSYYYQNVYQTKDNEPTVGKKAYYNHICYYSMMSIWYETYEGQTIRLTTDMDGYYLTTDNHGREVVINIADPTTPSGITVDEFLWSDNEDNTNYNYENGSETTTDIAIDSIEDWWKSVGDFFSNVFSGMDTVLRVALIILGAVGIIVVIAFVTKVMIWLFSGNNRSKRRRK